MSQVKSALRSGKGGPDIIGEMRMLEAFWTRYGVDEERLAQWPTQRVKDYLTVLHLEHEHESSKQNKPGSAGSGAVGASADDMTELAFKTMKGAEAPAPAVSADASVGPHPNAATRAERAKLFE